MEAHGANHMTDCKLRIRKYRGLGWGVILPPHYFGVPFDWWEPFDSFEAARRYVELTLAGLVTGTS